MLLMQCYHSVVFFPYQFTEVATLSYHIGSQSGVTSSSVGRLSRWGIPEFTLEGSEVVGASSPWPQQDQCFLQLCPLFSQLGLRVAFATHVRRWKRQHHRTSLDGHIPYSPCFGILVNIRVFCVRPKRFLQHLKNKISVPLSSRSQGSTHLLWRESEAPSQCGDDPLSIFPVPEVIVSPIIPSYFLPQAITSCARLG